MLLARIYRPPMKVYVIALQQHHVIIAKLLGYLVAKLLAVQIPDSNVNGVASIVCRALYRMLALGRRGYGRWLARQVIVRAVDSSEGVVNLAPQASQANAILEFHLSAPRVKNPPMALAMLPGASSREPPSCLTSPSPDGPSNKL